MKHETGHRYLAKTWQEYAHENGSRVLDFELLEGAGAEAAPVVAVYGLSPAAVAVGVMAQREARDVLVEEYVNILSSPIDAFGYGEQPAYH